MKEKDLRLLIDFSLAFGLVSICFFGFSRELKEQAIAERGNKCERCGKTGVPLFAHHILPQSMGGANVKENLYLVCHTCHQEVDRAAIEKGYLANGLNIQDVQSDLPEIIGNLDKFGKALIRFRKVKN